MRLFNLCICTALAVVLLALAPLAFAAGAPFTVSGKVVDRYGDPVEGANVTLIDTHFKVIKALRTDASGNYDFVNVAADTETCTVQFSYTDPQGTKYEMPVPYNRAPWYPTRGIHLIPASETTITNYPPPVYGYVYGVIQVDESMNSRYIDGVVYLVSLDSGVTYYEFAERADGKGSYIFYAPPGSYSLYAQHRENGVVYESARKLITIRPNTNIEEVIETRIVLPLYGPAANPDPAALPSRHENRVSGTVKTEDGKPAAGATVTLYQKADNGTGFIPARGAGSKPLTAVADASGYYEFCDVSPTTNDGKPIQAKKDVKAMAVYRLTENLTLQAWSEEEALYYPDVILGGGREGQACNVTLPVVLSLYDRAEPAVSVAGVPPAASDIAVVPLLAALAIGLVCLWGLYLALNRKG